MRYFCGKDIHGTVIPATANTFKDLVDRYVNIAVPLNVTRQQYAAMNPKEKDAAKQTHYLTPAVFNAAKVRRKTENATHCNLIFLDIDPAKDGRSSPATRCSPTWTCWLSPCSRSASQSTTLPAAPQRCPASGSWWMPRQSPWTSMLKQ